MSDFFSAAPTSETLQRFLAGLADRCPALRLRTVGHTVLQRPIPAAALGNPCRPTLLVGGVHGMEWITTLLLLRFLQELIDAGERLYGFDLRETLGRRGLLLLPCLNPDGVEIAAGYITPCNISVNFNKSDLPRWQANARGVDLNHNFDAGWAIAHRMEQQAGITGPGPTRYGGPAPHSEPETAALTALCRREQPRAAYAFHAQGEEIYWQYGACTPPGAATIAGMLAASSGYALRTPAELASHAGFKDWFIETMGRPGFTFEVGKGQNPLPTSDLPAIYQRLREALMLTLVL